MDLHGNVRVAAGGDREPGTQGDQLELCSSGVVLNHDAMGPVLVGGDHDSRTGRQGEVSEHVALREGGDL